MPLTASSMFPPGQNFQKFPSRRSVVHSTRGIVTCVQPLAAKCGIEVLEAGGNAADAAVAVAAALNLTEPGSTGIGGDMFCLYWDAKTQKVMALNGSGRAGAKCNPDAIRRSLGIESDYKANIPAASVHAVTVPGAASGWVDTVELFGSGRVTLEQILAPAIRLGEEGFPVSEIAAYVWKEFEGMVRKASPNFREILKEDPKANDGARAPRAGEIIRNPALAETFRTLAREGKKGFYTGRIAQEIINVVKDLGGFLELEDLVHHLEVGSEPVQPISLKFRGQGVAEAFAGSVVDIDSDPNLDFGIELWEHPPNGQGIVALMALGILQELELAGKIPTFNPTDFNTAPYLHAIIESLRIAFADASWFVTDPNVKQVPSSSLVSKEYLSERAKLFDPSKACGIQSHGSPAFNSCDTVYFAVSDSDGNAISFINSIYADFGTGIVPKGSGFILHNRGSSFSLDQSHPNVVEPRKRPYHTIIPAAVTNLHDGSLHSVYGVMGAFMQPQGQVQVLLGQIVASLNPQQALDAPRICIEAGGSHSPNTPDVTVWVEDGMSPETIEGLEKLGHQVKVLTGARRGKFGRGQIIRWTIDPLENQGVWSAGSDPRGDGAAYPL